MYCTAVLYVGKGRTIEVVVVLVVGCYAKHPRSQEGSVVPKKKEKKKIFLKK